MEDCIIILNEDIGKPNQIEEKLNGIKNSYDINPYSFKQFVELFSGEFRGLICYYKEKNKDNSNKNRWFKDIQYDSIQFKQIKDGRKIGYKIEKKDLLNWFETTVLPNTVLVTEQDYLFALKFSIACYIKMRQAPHGLAGMDRDMNQRLSNDILGKLAEIAVMKHAEKYGYKIGLAFDLWNLEEHNLTDYKYEKDIRTINGKEPAKNIEIKATKYRSSMQDVPMYITREEENHNFNSLIQAKLTLPKTHLLNYMNFDLLSQNISSSNDYLQNYKDDEAEYNKLLQKNAWKDLPIYISGVIDKAEMFAIGNDKLIIPCLNQEVKNKYFTFSALLDNSKERFKKFYADLLI